MPSHPRPSSEILLCSPQATKMPSPGCFTVLAKASGTRGLASGHLPSASTESSGLAFPGPPRSSQVLPCSWKHQPLPPASPKPFGGGGGRWHITTSETDRIEVQLRTCWVASDFCSCSWAAARPPGPKTGWPDEVTTLWEERDPVWGRVTQSAARHHRGQLACVHASC